jgi:hypothetical protein
MDSEEFKLSDNPFDYLDIVDEDDEELNKDAERAFFNFYESPEIQKTIYETIAQDVKNPNNPEILTLGTENKKKLFTMCNEELFIKKSRFVIKLINEIICTSSDNFINGYIDQTKLDWNRVSDSRPIYASAYNKFFSVKTNQPYVESKNNKNYLTVVNAVYNFLLNNSVEEEDYELIGDVSNPKLKGEEIEFNDSIAKISCKCQKLFSESGAAYSSKCAPFSQLKNIPAKTLDILHKLLVIFQSSAVSLVDSFNNYLSNVKCKYDKLLQTTGCKPIAFMYFDTYYYFDEHNNSLVTFFKIFLQIEGNTKDKPEFIPIYKVINVYPIKKYDYSYSFFYIDNDTPYGDGKYNNKLEQIDVFKFIETRIKLHLGLDVENFRGFFYIGEDLKNYQKSKALIHKERNKANMNAMIGGKRKYKGRLERKRTTKKIHKNKKTRKNKKTIKKHNKKHNRRSTRHNRK